MNTTDIINPANPASPLHTNVDLSGLPNWAVLAYLIIGIGLFIWALWPEKNKY